MHQLSTWSILAILLLTPTLTAQERRPISFDDLMAVQRVGDPQPSPDGKWVAYTVTVIEKAQNARNTDIWLIPLAGGDPRRLTTFEKLDDRPRWSPDGKALAFISTRGGEPQVWVLDVAGGEPRQVTRLSTGASGVLWSPDGRTLAFVSEVYPDCPDDTCNRTREEERAKSPVKARLFHGLLFRHWNAWKDGKRSHLFVVDAQGGEPRDLTPGDADVPPFSLGGPDDYTFSPDGQELSFAQKTDPVEALSTNSDLFVVPVVEGAPRRITTNPAADASPLYSPDGRYLAYRAQVRPGSEADRWRLMLYDRKTGATTALTENFDRWVGSFAWSPDSRKIFFAADDQGGSPIYALSIKGGKVEKILEGHTNDDLKVTADGKSLVFVRQSMAHPVEIYRTRVDGKDLVPLTRTNEALLGQLDLREPESLWYEGAGGTRVQAFLLKPPGFDPARKYPLLLLVHGGPQSVWADAFHFRWNAQLFAAAGYMVFLPNPRGSVGFGQEFVDEISGDWGGRVYEDLMRGVDHVLRLGFVDPSRLGAAGASYGGYMVNWIAGHTPRFKALVSHAGVFNLVSMYGVTEELWFPEWEFSGPPWENPEMYARWSPSEAVTHFRTPLLVTHGELDFRVPIGEGFQLFTALQRRGIPAQMLYFPDEGHWISKPLNSELWYQTVIGWLDQYLKP